MHLFYFSVRIVTYLTISAYRSVVEAGEAANGLSSTSIELKTNGFDQKASPHPMTPPGPSFPTQMAPPLSASVAVDSSTTAGASAFSMTPSESTAATSTFHSLLSKLAM